VVSPPPPDGSWSAQPSSEDIRRLNPAPSPGRGGWNPAASSLEASGAASYPAPGSSEDALSGGGLRVGSQLGPYLIRGLLGRGGMGAVYDALHTGLERPVALKTLLEASDGPEEIQRFLIEAQALGRLDHPHVVRLYDAGEVRGLRYLALEKVEGQSLAELLSEGPLPAREAARILTGLCEGVAAAHALGILHRDLKPDNVLMSLEGTPRLTDFGLARIDRRRLTQTGEVMGTPNFMAPEQVRGERARQGPVTDVYGLGCVLYACLSGESPYAERAGALAVLAAAADGGPRPLRQAAPKTPADLQAIAARAMAREPEDRYPSASELRLDLERFLRGEPVEARPLGLAARVGRRVRRELPLLSGAVLVTSLLCGGIFLAARPYLGGQEGVAQAQAEAWRARELERLRGALPNEAANEAASEVASEAAALEALAAEAAPAAIRARARAALAPEGASLSDASRRGLEGEQGLELSTATLRARIYAALGARPGGAGAAALASAVVLAPESDSGRAARLELGRRLRRRASDPGVGPALSADARRAAQELLAPLAGASAPARRELAWLQAGELRFAEALALCGETSTDDELELLRSFTQGLAQAEPLGLEGGEVLLESLPCGRVLSGGAGARLIRPDGTVRRFPKPPGASRLKACAWGPLRVPGRAELHLVWVVGSSYSWQTHDLGAQHDEAHEAWRGRPPRDVRGLAFGDFDGDRCLDLALVSYAGAQESCVVFAPERAKPSRRLLWGRPDPQARATRPYPAGPISVSSVRPYGFQAALALDLIPESSGPPRDELVLTPTELASPPAVLVMGVRDQTFVCLGDLLHGPVAGAQVGELDGKAVVVLTTDREPGARAVGLGALEQEGHTLLGGGLKGEPKFLARWSHPGAVGDEARQAHRGLSAWTISLAGRSHLVRGLEARAGGYRLQVTPWADLRKLSEGGRGEAVPPLLDLHLPRAPAQAPRVQRTGLVWGDVRYGPGAARSRGSAGVSGVVAKRTRAEALAWAGHVLERLGHEDEAALFAAELRARYPSASVTRDLEWERIERGLSLGREAEAAAGQAFSALLSDPGREEWTLARARYLETAQAAEACARELRPWSPPPGAAWELASRAYLAAGKLEEGLAAAAAGAEAPGVSLPLRERLEQIRARWAPRASWGRLALPTSLEEPAGLALGPRGLWNASWPAVAPGPSSKDAGPPGGEPAPRVRVAAEFADGFLIPFTAGGGPWRLDAELEVQGSAWCGELDLGVFRAEDEGRPARCTGLRFGFWDVFTRRLNICPSVDGRLSTGRRVGWPGYDTRIGVTLLVSTTAAGRTRFCWELRDGAGRLAFRRVETLVGSAATGGRLYLGLVSAPSRNTKDASSENGAFGQESSVIVGRLELRAPRARTLSSDRKDPRELLWSGHAALARGDADSALGAYSAALARVDRRPRPLQGVSHRLSASARDLRWEISWWRGIARTGSGDADGWRDLKACLEARPDQGLRALEALASGAPREFERRAAEPLLDALVAGADPLLVTVGRHQRDGELGPLDRAWARSDAARERTLIRLQCAQASARGQSSVLATLRAVLRAWEPRVHLPRLRLPLVLRTGRLPLGMTFEQLCRPSQDGSATPRRDLARARVAIAHAPSKPGGYYLAAISLHRLRILGLATDAAREVLRREPTPVMKITALHVLAQQALAVEDWAALRHWKGLLAKSGVAEIDLDKHYPVDSPR